MKKISIVVTVCGIALAHMCWAQLNPDLISANVGAGRERPTIAPAGPIHSQFLIFNDTDGAGDAGTYNPTDEFGFDIYLTYSGYDCYGLSLWLETQTLNNFGGSLSITGMTYGTAFPEALQTQPNPAPFDVSSGASTAYRRENRDLGALVPGAGDDFLPRPPGTYFIGHVSFTIMGAQPGTYILKSTTVLHSETTSYDGTTFMDNNLPAATYTITIVPEPSTSALLVLMAIGVVPTLFRRAFVKKPAA